MAHGQIARVAGVTADEAWWLLDCPIAAPGLAEHCWVLAGEPYTLSQPDATRIAAESDVDPLTVEGVINGDEQRHYVFHADAGQQIAIVLSSPGNSVLFHVQGLADGVVYKHLLDGETSWQTTVSQSQDYLLALNASGDSVTYTIELQRTAPVSAPPFHPRYPVVGVQSGLLPGGFTPRPEHELSADLG